MRLTIAVSNTLFALASFVVAGIAADNLLEALMFLAFGVMFVSACVAGWAFADWAFDRIDARRGR
jgi:hypothetical protein